jgi:Wings apart-like protein regulation of heterochromatin
VRQAQDSGESVRIMDDLMYALDGLSAKLPASTQQESAIAIAETALTQRGRMALRFALTPGASAASRSCSQYLGYHRFGTIGGIKHVQQAHRTL